MENVEVRLSTGRTAELRALKAREQMNADRCSKGEPILLLYYRVAASLAKLGDEEIPPAASDLALESVIDRLTGAEVDELGAAYAEHFSAKPEALKNE